MQYRPKIFMLNMQEYTGSEISNSLIPLSIMAQAIPSVIFPHPGLCQALVTLSVLGVGNLSENLYPGVRHLSILLEAVNLVPFSIVHLKIRLIR